MNRRRRTEIVEDIRRVSQATGVPPYALQRDVYLGLCDGVRERELRILGGWEAARELAAQTPDALEAYRLRQRILELKSQNALLLERLDAAEHAAGVAEELESHEVEVTIERRASGAAREATAVVLASDWHVEETVEADTVNGLNAYDLSVAEKRAERFFDGIRHLVGYHQEHFELRDLVLWLGGDLITGYIHEELVEGNSLSPTYAASFVRALLGEGIRYLLRETSLERIVVPCSHGNHGRTTAKARIATAAANSFEHFMYRMLRDDFAGEPRVQFHIARGAFLYVDVYDKTIRFHHGDFVRYAGGVGGISIPLNKAIARWQVDRHADLTCIGHYHQYSPGQRVVTNGSLIGYGPYAQAVASYEPAQQAFFLVDSKRGPCMHTPIWCEASDEPDSERSASIRKEVTS